MFIISNPKCDQVLLDTAKFVESEDSIKIYAKYDDFLSQNSKISPILSQIISGIQTPVCFSSKLEDESVPYIYSGLSTCLRQIVMKSSEWHWS